MPGYSERYEAALVLAARAHRHQVRKASDVPYLVHPVHVSVILLRYGLDEDVAIAALLHDVVEDQDVPLSEIEAFGPRVARIVAALTETKREGGVPRPWETRKQEALDDLVRGDVDVAAVKAADVLHTVNNLAAGLRALGPSLWRSFSRGPGPTLAFYQRVVSVIGDKLPGHPLAAEVASAVERLAQVIGGQE